MSFVGSTVEQDTSRKRLIAIMYLTSGVLLLILLYDLQVGNIVPGIKGGGTLPHQVYVLVLPALAHIMYKCLRGKLIWQK